MKKIAPYTVHREISMMKDKSKNTNMKLENEFVKNGQINIAKEEYLKIYNQTGQIEAGYNAARLMEAQGNYEEAEKMQAQMEQREEREKKAIIPDTIPDELNEK